MGGEFLSSLSPLPKYTCATEGYEPNIIIARNRLEPLGVKVYRIDGAPKYEYYDWDLQTAVTKLNEAGLKIIEQKEDIVKTRFYDIGAIAFYLKAVPWQVPDFTVEKYFQRLKEIHNMIQKEGYIDFTCHRFLVIAYKE